MTTAGPSDERADHHGDERASHVRDVIRFTLRIGELRSMDETNPLLTSGLTVPQMRVLFAAAGRQGARPSVIAERTGMAPPNVTSVLSRLEERNLIARAPDPEDRRATVIMLSPEGRQLAREISAAGREKFESSLSNLSDDELAGLARGLGAVVRAMDQRAPGRIRPEAG